MIRSGPGKHLPYKWIFLVSDYAIKLGVGKKRQAKKVSEEGRLSG